MGIELTNISLRVVRSVLFVWWFWKHGSRKICMRYKTCWWFGTFFHILGILIPTDWYFSEGLKPPTRKTYKDAIWKTCSPSAPLDPSNGDRERGREREREMQKQTEYVAVIIYVDIIMWFTCSGCFYSLPLSCPWGCPSCWRSWLERSSDQESNHLTGLDSISLRLMLMQFEADRCWIDVLHEIWSVV